MGEFELIARHFAQQASAQTAPALRLGIGDDAAILTPTPGHELVISTDMLVEGRHFFADVDSQTLGHKALAVNLSDMAAMGAQPLGFTLALALPSPDEHWLAGFSRGLFSLATAHSCALIGGDTTRGPLNLCLTVFGEVPAGKALRRSGARAGDDIYISGTIGEARLALASRLGEPWALAARELITESEFSRMQARLDMPSPRLSVGTGLRGWAHSAIDLSDGLGGDLMHILQASGVGAEIAVDALPAADGLKHLTVGQKRQCQIDGGDDYELLFTAPVAHREAIAALAKRCSIALTVIGRVTDEAGLVRWLDAQGEPVGLVGRSFDHFAQRP